MTGEFSVNNLNSFHDFGLKILKRKVGSAQKDSVIERVPFSSVTHDFSRIFGKNSYGERTVSYECEFVCMDKKVAQEKIIFILKNLKWAGRKDLFDENHGIYNFKIKFAANPEIKPNISRHGRADYGARCVAREQLFRRTFDGKI